MTITIQHVNPSATRVYMGTLTQGEDLHAAFIKLARHLNIQAATFELLGGLHEAEFTAYDFTTQTRHPALTCKGALEVVAGHGTISLLEGEPHVHTHLAVAYRENDTVQMMAGHAARAVVFAVEFTLTVYDGAPVYRALDAATGLKLWHLPEVTHE